MPDTHSTDTEPPPPSVITDDEMLGQLLEEVRSAFRNKDAKRARACLHLLTICAEELG